jgi:hypothetical protein
MQIGTEKAVLFWRKSVTCHLCAPINRTIFESKECIVKLAYCVRDYTLHIPQWKYFSIQCSPPVPSHSPGHSDTHNGVREDSIRLGCVAVTLADGFFLHWLPWKVMGKDTTKPWEESPSDTASHSRRLEPSDECNPYPPTLSFLDPF